MAAISNLGRICNLAKFAQPSRLCRHISSNTVLLRQEDTPIHTGQKWDSDDVRMVRFVNREKTVNQKFAIDLIAEVPAIESKDRIVSCNGGGGPLGHPKIYINLDQPGNHTCGYCGLRFYKDDHHH